REDRLGHARTVLRIKPVAGAAYGDEVTWLLGVVLEALPELTDEVVDGADRSGRLPPHEVEQLRAREHLVRVAHEEHEQLELEVGQLDLDVVLLDGALPEVDRDAGELDEVAVRRGDRRRRWKLPGAAQHGLDAREQLRETE